MRVHASILVQRPIAAVHAYLSTAAHLPDWLAGVTAAQGVPPDQLEVGATLALERTSRLGDARSTWEVIAYEPPRSLALRGLDEGLGPEVRWTLEGVAGGATRVWVEADLGAVSFFQLPSTDLDEPGLRQVQDHLAALRRCLEAGEGAT